jgi:hypothetical protein
MVVSFRCTLMEDVPLSRAPTMPAAQISSGTCAYRYVGNRNAHRSLLKQGDSSGATTMAENSGTGFMGLIAGLLIAAILVIGGLFIFGGGLNQGGTDIKVEVPEVQAPG